MLDLHYYTGQLIPRAYYIIWYYITLYYTTSRYHTDGEWWSIILSFSDGTDFELRPLFFAYEDREQIVLLLVETIKQLSLAATESDESTKKLRGNLFALMTDSVSKNLKIEDGISESLGSTYKMIHLPCKSQTQQKSWIIATRSSDKFWDKSQTMYCVGKY